MQAATCVNEPDRLFGKQIEATNQVLGTPTCHMFTPKVPPCPACPLLRAGPLGSSGAGPGCVRLAPANCLINSCAEQGRKKENPGEGDIFHAAVSKAAARPPARADPVRPICPRRTKRAAWSRTDRAASPAQGLPGVSHVCVCAFHTCVCCQVPDIATRLLGCPKCSVPSWPRQGSRRCRLDEVGCDGCHCGPRFCSAACVSAVSCSAGGGTSSGFARSHFLATLTMYVRALDHSVQLPGAGGMLWHLEEEALQPGGLITALIAGSSAGA